MRIIDVVLPNSHEIVLAGDEQQGNLLFWEEGWNKCVDYVHEKSNRFLVHMGDQIEGIMVDDKRYDPKIHGFNYPLIQQRDCLKRLKKVKDRLLVILDSNHNHALWKLGDLAEDIVFELQKAGSKIQYGTFTCKLIIRDKDKKVMYKVYLTHGRKSIQSYADDPIRSLSNMKLILKRQLKQKAADCIVMAKGHAHKLLVCEPVDTLIMVDDGKRIKQKYIGAMQGHESYIHPDHRYYGCTGSFLKLYGDNVSGYAERGEMDPVDLGFLSIKCEGRNVIGLEAIRL